MSNRILFVCLGNICRSPAAHGIFERLAHEAGVEVTVDSAGTGSWHVGDAPDARARIEARLRGYDLEHLRARKVALSDFDAFDLIIAMDNSNLHDLEDMRPAGNTTPVKLFLPYGSSDELEVPDPYYSGGFGHVFDLLEDASRGLLRAL